MGKAATGVRNAREPVVSDYVDLVRRLHHFAVGSAGLFTEAADAIEALVAERDALRSELAQAVIERDNNQVSRDEWKAKYLATKALPVGGQLLKAVPVGWHGDTTNPRGDDRDPEGL